MMYSPEQLSGRDRFFGHFFLHVLHFCRLKDIVCFITHRITDKNLQSVYKWNRFSIIDDLATPNGKEQMVTPFQQELKKKR